LRVREGYCLRKEPGGIVIDYRVCNECAQCVALCPSRAFSIDNCLPGRVDYGKVPSPESLLELFGKRRSTRDFSERRVERSLLETVVQAGRWAPTMNRDIEAIVIDDPAVVETLDRSALRFYTRMYRLLFGNAPVFWFISRFARTMDVVKIKLERSIAGGRIVYRAPALIALIGNERVPLTVISAQYHLYNMILYAECCGLGTCLMDSVKIAFSAHAGLRRLLGVPRGMTVVGALLLGYPRDKVLNKPDGQRMTIWWNRRG
jgi:nitroreductase